jgi:uncharacterized membrane-anchored protein YjiN (DUF445 family)
LAGSRRTLSSVSLQSDNLDTLVAFHGRLASDKERQPFATALLDRLDEHKGYLAVSCFIVAVLVARSVARAPNPVP